MLENMLRRILGSKTEEVIGEWRKLHNEELCNVYSLPNFIKIMENFRGIIHL
jgi:hypothetical protein